MILTAGLMGIFKLAVACAIGGISFNLYNDLKDLEVWRKMVPIKKVSSIPMGDYHMSILGATRHGKTYATLKSLKGVKKGVFFFNFQQEDVPKGFITCDGNDSIHQMQEVVDSGGKINFIPNRDRDQASAQLKAIVGLFLGDSKKRDMYLVIDEVHLYSKVGINAAMQVATAGARWGVYGIFITQRPANMDNNLLGQSYMTISFNLKEVDREYLRRQGLPIDDMMYRIGNEKYKFVVYDGLKVEGAYMI